MLNFVQTFGATKRELRGRVELLAPSALCAGTTEGTCAETPYISLLYKNSSHQGESVSLLYKV
jgi:hypothetical protein